MRTINLALALHNHQPVGNFDHVFDKAVKTAYEPFLNEFDQFPEMRITLHFSGCLLEWMEACRPQVLRRVKALVEAGRAELMGGGMYEPIFVMLSDRDKQEQIHMMRSYLETRFGVKPRGAWVPERIWEQGMVTPLARAGVEYGIVDDFHFKCAGLPEEQLTGYFLTEDQGALMRVFASSEKLRYYIPFQDPERTIEYLQTMATEDGQRLIVYGDDGEKFGLWPETFAHVYQNGWLRRFLSLLDRNRDWIKLVTLSQAMDTLPAAGKIYLPDASYREMTEWALPTDAQKRLEATAEQLKHTAFYEQARPFLRGGFWRNFKVKYPESNQMYARMMEVSRKLEGLSRKAKAYEQARQELFRGQCNCAYWHGVFGGLYLPHLRSAVFERLIKADTIMDQAAHGKKAYAETVAEDFDLDGTPEIRMANARVVLHVKPSRGGHITEFDVRAVGANLGNTLSRRPEAYHAKLLNLNTGQHGESVKSIHDITAVKSADLDKKLNYDWYQRESLIDHFFEAGAALEASARGQRVESGDFVDTAYEAQIGEDKSAAIVTLTRTGSVSGPAGRTRVEVVKRIHLDKDAEGPAIEYTIRNAGDTFLDGTFGVEFNLAMMAGSDPIRYYRVEGGGRGGLLAETTVFENHREIGVVDEFLRMDVRLTWSEAAQVWAYPIETVSQSESGFELVFQSAAVIPRWPVRLKPQEAWRLDMTWEAGKPRSWRSQDGGKRRG